MGKKFKKTIVFGGDHNFFELIIHLKEFLEKLNYQVIDVSQSDFWRKVDYNEQTQVVANIVKRSKDVVGILGCGTGQGCAITANKIEGIRAALCYSEEFAKKSREHNDSNILVLGAWQNSKEEMERICLAWLDEKFGEERHIARVNKIEQNSYKHKVVLLPGIFDGISPLHIEMIKYAKKIGFVVIALNSDESVKKITGKSPIKGLWYRKTVLSGLSGVDEIIINEDINVSKILKEIKADYVLKGNNFTEDFVIKNDRVPKGTKVIIYQPPKDFIDV